jgi:hypothetical protein
LPDQRASGCGMGRHRSRGCCLCLKTGVRWPGVPVAVDWDWRVSRLGLHAAFRSRPGAIGSFARRGRIWGRDSDLELLFPQKRCELSFEWASRIFSFATCFLAGHGMPPENIANPNQGPDAASLSNPTGCRVLRARTKV